MMITFTLRIVLFQEITFQYVMPLVVLAVRFFLTLILNYLLDYFFFWHHWDHNDNVTYECCDCKSTE